MLICDIAAVGPAVHAWHLALHLGLATVVSVGGSIFLALGVRSHRRTMRRLALEARGPASGEPRVRDRSRPSPAVSTA